MAARHFFLQMFALAALVGLARAQTTIPLNNSGQQTFAFDAANHFLYVAQESSSNHNLNVVNTLTNTVVGSTSYSGGFSSQVATAGTSVFWADQGSSFVRVFSVNGSGVPSASPVRSDSASLATGLAALSTSYAVSKQGTGDFMDIRNLSGTTLFSVNLGGVAGQVYADSNTGRYYARSSSSFQVIDASTGGIVRTLGTLVFAVDSAATHNFVYTSSGTQFVNQLSGVANSQTGSYDFGSGASITDVAVNSANGDIFVALAAQNKVVQLSSSMSFLAQYSVTGAQSVWVADGELFVAVTGNNFLTVFTAIPEPGTTAALFGGLGLIFSVVRRRRGSWNA